jgi:hypothetical protein
MKKFLVLALAVVLSVSAVLAEEKPIDVTVWEGVQIFSPETSIKGVRINFLYGVNKDITGLDLGLFIPVNFVNGNMKGLQLGLYNRVSGNVTGVQWGLVNNVLGNFTGWQSALVNFTDGDFVGFQQGFFNSAKSMKGLQWGFWNQTDSLKGIQLGLLNFNKAGVVVWESAKAPNFFPFVNWAF